MFGGPEPADLACRTREFGDGSTKLSVASEPVVVPGCVVAGFAMFGDPVSPIVGELESTLAVVAFDRRDESAMLEPPEGRIDRAGTRLPSTATLGLEGGDEFVAVHRRLGKQRQHRVADRTAPSATTAVAAAVASSVVVATLVVGMVVVVMVMIVMVMIGMVPVAVNVIMNVIAESASDVCGSAVHVTSFRSGHERILMRYIVNYSDISFARQPVRMI